MNDTENFSILSAHADLEANIQQTCQSEDDTNSDIEMESGSHDDFKFCKGCEKNLSEEYFYSHFKYSKCKQKYQKEEYQKMMTERRNITNHRARSKKGKAGNVIKGIKNVLDRAKKIINSSKSLKEDGPIHANARLKKIKFSLSPTQPDTPGFGNCLAEAIFDQIR